MSKILRKNRQDGLTNDQKAKIVDFLGKKPGTSSFIREVDDLLKAFSSKDFIDSLEDDKRAFIKLKKISKMANELATFLEKGPIEGPLSSDEATDDERALFYLNHPLKVEGCLKNDPEYGERFISETCSNLRRIEKLLSDHLQYQLDRFVPKTRPRDVELEMFTKNIIFRFETHVKRLPVASIGNPDIEALRIIYEAFGHFEIDMVKRIKNGNKLRREVHRKKGKYKIKFGD